MSQVQKLSFIVKTEIGYTVSADVAFILVVKVDIKLKICNYTMQTF